MLSRFVIALLPRSKCLLMSQLQSPSAVILEPKEIKSVTVSIVSPSICHEVMRPDAYIYIYTLYICINTIYICINTIYTYIYIYLYNGILVLKKNEIMPLAMWT